MATKISPDAYTVFSFKFSVFSGDKVSGSRVQVSEEAQAALNTLIGLNAHTVLSGEF